MVNGRGEEREREDRREINNPDINQIVPWVSGSQR